MTHKLNSFRKSPNLWIPHRRLQLPGKDPHSGEVECINRRQCNWNGTPVYWFCDWMQNALPQCTTITIGSTSQGSILIDTMDTLTVR